MEIMNLEDYLFSGIETQVVSMPRQLKAVGGAEIKVMRETGIKAGSEAEAETKFEVRTKALKSKAISAATENQYSSYHVLVRGTRGHKIFFKREDYYRFLFLLNRFLHSAHSSIYGFVLMTNHAHMLIHSDCINDVVCNLVKGYEGYFYCKYQRVKPTEDYCGPKLVNESNQINVKRTPLIEMPVKIVEKISIDYQLDNLYYIINNPILSGLCIRPGGYSYSSYLFYTKHGTFLSQFIDVDTSLIFKNDKTLQAFNKKRSKRLAYQISTKERKKCGIKGDWNEVG
jgi:hypothetical protein